mgnify:CR=1 FL=1
MNTPENSPEWTPPLANDDPNPDRQALAKTGRQVLDRLRSDPWAERIPTDRADLYAFHGFVTPDECEHLVRLIDRVAKPSAMHDHGYGKDYRTSFSGDVDTRDPVVRAVERRLDDCLGLDPSWGETVQGQRYAVSQEFREHYDWFWTRGDYWPEESRRGGQRSWTTMVYLNDVEEGGETDFTRLGLAIPPQRGFMLAWNNALADGSLNYDTLHAGKPVLRGTKYIVTKWYRTRKWG